MPGCVSYIIRKTKNNPKKIKNFQKRVDKQSCLCYPIITEGQKPIRKRLKEDLQ
nr:MAG TPA: hypothetical protein [Caudoviricetes sp.]